jgi:hypothetical protein
MRGFSRLLYATSELCLKACGEALDFAGFSALMRTHQPSILLILLRFLLAGGGFKFAIAWSAVRDRRTTDL